MLPSPLPWWGYHHAKWDLLSEVPEALFYTKNHEWVSVKADGVLRVGVTHHAQRELGDVVYVDLQPMGSRVAQEGSFGTIEAVKAVSDLFMPVSGKIVAVNGTLEQQPELVNRAPYEAGWMIEIAPEDKRELEALLGADDYKKLT